MSNKVLPKTQYEILKGGPKADYNKAIDYFERAFAINIQYYVSTLPIPFKKMPSKSFLPLTIPGCMAYT